MRRIFLCILCLCLLPWPARCAEAPKYVALTFDDGPSGRFTRRLLEGLEARGAKATFLLCGYRMELMPTLAGKILEGGHEIGLHGFSHKPMNKMSREEVRRELDRTQTLLPDGYTPAFLRPPGGAVGQAVREEAKARGLAVLNWYVDPMDWSCHDAAKVADYVVGTAEDGDVILLHDMSDSSVDAALRIVEELQERGFQFVTASELARLRGISPAPGQVYTHFPPSGEKPSSPIGRADHSPP